jgi:uncharacterized protein
MGSISDLNNGLTLFFSLLIPTVPSLFIGVVISSSLLLWFESERNRRKQKINVWDGLFIGILCSLVAPVGQYGHFPIARRLFLTRTPISVAIAFFLSAPTFSLGNLWITYRVFATKSDLIWWRLGTTLIITILITLIFSTIEQKAKNNRENSAEIRLDSPVIQSGTTLSTPLRSSQLVLARQNIGNDAGEELNAEERKQAKALAKRKLTQQVDRFINNLFKEFWEFGAVLILGCAVATITLMTIDRADFLLVTSEPRSSIGRLMLCSFILSLGANANTAFLATLGAFFTKGAIVASLVFCAFVDLKSIGLLLLTFRPKIAVYLLSLSVLLAFLSGAIVDSV